MSLSSRHAYWVFLQNIISLNLHLAPSIIYEFISTTTFSWDIDPNDEILNLLVIGGTEVLSFEKALHKHGSGLRCFPLNLFTWIPIYHKSLQTSYTWCSAYLVLLEMYFFSIDTESIRIRNILLFQREIHSRITPLTHRSLCHMMRRILLCLLHNSEYHLSHVMTATNSPLLFWAVSVFSSSQWTFTP